MKKPVIVATALAAAVLIASAAWAAIPDSGGVIHGCYLTKGGLLRVVDTDAGQTCTKYEVALTWNQTGPQGLPGATGATGQAGSDGATGATGPAGEPTHFYNLGQGLSVPPGVSETFISCDPGDVAISGVFPITFGEPHLHGDGEPTDYYTYPSPGEHRGAGTQEQWRFFLSNPDSGPQNVIVFVTCADLAPYRS
jgi:hypothetical protein